MLQVSLIGYAAAGAFLNLGFFDLYYAIIALVAVLKALVVKEVQQAEVTRHEADDALALLSSPSGPGDRAFHLAHRDGPAGVHGA